MRISGVEIPYKKRVVIALTYIHGIGLSTSKKICLKLKIPSSQRVKDLSNEMQQLITKEIETYTVEGELRLKVINDIKRLIAIKAYRGIRHRMGMPTRGQNTRNNGKTAKKLNGKHSSN